MDILIISFLLGRVLLGGYFLFNGVMHLKQLKSMVGYAASHGVPFTTVSVFVASLLILLGGAGVLLGIYPEWSLIALIVFLVPVTFYMHAFWKVADPDERRMARIQFLKNIALLGAILMLLSVGTPWPYSLFP
ncbi:MAG: DoxX family membrane protein [Parcubacteria group bacterium]|nr:DoxX family membrane protein [Parcubacteria group bacterium]